MITLTEKKKPQVIISCFIRKGGEGLFTKIVTESNKHQFADLQSHLFDGEYPLIVYRKRNPDWMMLSNYRLLSQIGNNFISLSHHDLDSVRFAMQEEAERGITNKLQYSILKIISKQQKEYFFEVESGKPFIGLINTILFITKGD